MVGLHDGAETRLASFHMVAMQAICSSLLYTLKFNYQISKALKQFKLQHHKLEFLPLSSASMVSIWC